MAQTKPDDHGLNSESACEVARCSREGLWMSRDPANGSERAEATRRESSEAPANIEMSDHDPAAERAAIEWLALADRGDASASWEAAATLFRRAVSEEQWQRSLVAAREPLGGVVSRELAGARFATELPGAPDGEYVVCQFSTVFEHKRAATETVTPMRDSDGVWRVSGYFIR